MRHRPSANRRRARLAQARRRRYFPAIQALEARQMLVAGAFLQGTVYNDLDADGMLDPAEPYLAGATIRLYASDGVTLRAQATTDAQGAYRFDDANVTGGDLAPGTYRIVETPPAGYLRHGAQAVSPLNPASVLGPDAIQVTLVDPAGLTLTLDSVGTGENATVAVDGGAQGTYAGPLNLTAARPNLPATALASNCVDIGHHVGYGDTFGVLPRPAGAGLARNGGRMAYLFNHYTADPALTAPQAAGLQLALWELELDDAPDLGAGRFVVSSASADAVAAANAFLAESANKSESAIFLDATMGGQSVPTTGRQGMMAGGSYNFGNVAPATPPDIPLGSLSGSVYLDADDDGRKDAGEDGLGGVVVTLAGALDVGGAAVAMTTRTARDGSYRFEHLRPGTYALAETPPAGLLDAKDTPGSRGGTVGRKRFSAITLAAGAEGRGYNFGHQRAPEFASTPIREAGLSREDYSDGTIHQYEYQARAVDADGDRLRYTLLIGPDGMAVDPDTGMVTWFTDYGDLGAHDVALRVEDLRGGWDEQRYTLTVSQDAANRPPYFTSEPIVDAWVATPYTYRATARDPDLDTLTFTKIVGPADLDVDPATGLVTWTPTADRLGPNPVTLKVADGRGGEATHQFTILVGSTPGNHPPIIVSTPIDRLSAAPSDFQPGSLDDHVFTVPGVRGQEVTTTFRMRGFDTAYSNEFGFYRVLDAQGRVARPAIPDRFDFGTADSPVAAGHARVTDASAYRPARGYGWYSGYMGYGFGTDVDRGPGVGSDLSRDLHLTGDHTFIVDVADGTYDVTLTLGDPGPYARDQMGIYLEDALSGSVDTAAGQVVTRTYRVAVADGQLTVRLQDLGGSDSDVALAGLEIQAVPGTVAGPLSNLLAPGDPGYAEVALAQGRAQVIFRQEARAGDTAAVRFRAGEFVAFFLVQNAAYSPPDESGAMPTAFFSLPQANFDDQTDHLRAVTRTAEGLTEFGWEDLTGGGDLDFNDCVYTIDPILIRGAAGPVYAYQVVAVDADDDPLTYSLPVGPPGAQINARTGLVSWAATPGSHAFTVRVDDGHGFDTPGQVQGFTLIVDNFVTSEIHGLAFNDEDGNGVRSASERGLAGRPVFLDTDGDGQVDAGEPTTTTDPEGRYAFRGLAAGTYTVAASPPAGWLSTAPAGGSYQVALATGQFAVGRDFGAQDPLDVNHDPSFQTSPPTQAAVGQLLRYDALATDPDGDRLVYDLVMHPAGMGVDLASGVVVWVPQPGQEGPQSAVLRVRDGRGGAALHPIPIEVGPANRAPRFTVPPAPRGVAGRTYTSEVRAVDPDGDPLTYSVVSGPAGLGFHDPARPGLLTWPSAPQGTYPGVAIAAADGRGGVATLTFPLQVVADAGNRDPIITSDYRRTIQLDRTYRYQVVATDEDDDPLAYSLVGPPTGMTIDPVTGLVTWMPVASATLNQFGPHTFHVRADDGRGTPADQEVTVRVVSQSANGDPTIAGTLPPSAVVGQPYSARLTGSDPDNDPLLWSLATGPDGAPEAPDGMVIDPRLGAVAWLPTADQLGPRQVTVRVDDGQGGWTTRAYAVTVRGANRPPRIGELAPPAAGLGVAYALQIVATDPEGDALDFELIGAVPSGMTIDDAGLLLWPSPGPVGSQGVTVRVADTAGNTATATFAIAVASGAPNRPPRITSNPVDRAIVGQEYQYDVSAVDDDGDAITYSVQGPPSGMTIDAATGLIRWTPAGPASAAITVVATDARGAWRTQAFAITARADSPPTLAPIPDAAVARGASFRYDVNASDPDAGDTLRYTLAGPSWLAIDAAGRIAGRPDASVALGPYTVQVAAIDDYGLASPTRSFTLTVGADVTAPKVQVHLVTDPVDVGKPATILVTAADDVGVAALTLTVGGVPVRLDAHGAAVVTRDAAGNVAVVATATDAAGNTSAPAYATQRVIDPSVTSRPTAAILAPGAGPVTVITAPTPVRFTAADANLVLYTLAYAPLDSDDFTTIDAGYAPVTDRSVTFDPTLLANGTYTLRLTARNSGGVEAVDERVVSVEGKLKLGNLRMSFVDLAVPVAGIPITITRTYDSLDAKTDGDFGHGWSLEETGYRVQVSQPDGTLQDAGLHQAFRAGTRVVVTRPGRDPEAFVFLPRQRVAGYFATQYYQPQFVPVSGVTSRLSVSDAVLVKFGDDFFNYDADLTPYNPTDPAANPSRAYNLTGRDGTVSVFDAETGRIATVTDRAGHSLTFGDDGIHSDTGRGVEFVRDPQTRRITKIVDPEGREIAYGYDAAGDLRTVTAPFDGPQTSTTQLLYDAARPHFLKQVIDPLGRAAAQTYYGPDGRIERVVDAAGKETRYEWHADTLVQRVTDQLDNTTVLTLDARGNVLRTVDPEGGIAKRSYDGRDHLLAETTVVGAEDTPGGESNDLTTSYTYVNGDRATITDPRGNVTYFTYNAFGQPTGAANADGGTSSSYDEYGLPRWSRDIDGNTTYFDYDKRGNLERVRNDDGQVLASSTYNTYGEVTGVTPAAGRATSLDYTPDGKVAGRWSFDGTGASQVQVLDVTRHDDAGRVVATIHAVLPQGQFLTQDLADAVIPPQYVKSSTATTYNKAGQVLSQTDPYGRVTEHTYDRRGLEIQVRTQSKDGAGATVWTVTRTVYDAAGRAVVATDPYLEGAATVAGTRSVYDKVGRSVAGERLKGLRVDLTGSGDLREAVVGLPGTVVSPSSTTYDPAGRVTASTDADGLETQSTYNRSGETVQTRTRSYDQANQPVWLVTRTVFDARGRAILATDPFVEGSSAPVFATETVHDDRGRAFRTVRREGVQVGLVGGETQWTGKGTERWKTETGFDAEGRVGRTVAADGHYTDFAYDDLGRRWATIGHPVVLGGETVRLRSETVYDAEGRVWKERTNLRQRADGTVDASAVRVTTHAYDEAGNLVLTTFADGTTVAATYDTFGRRRSETNQLGKTRTFEYEALTGRLAAVELPAVADPLQGGTPVRPRYEYGYDARGNQTLIRDPLGRETRLTYDAEGRQLTRTLPLGFGPDGRLGSADDATLPEGTFAERSEYDDRGRPTLHVSFEGVVTQSLYSTLTGRLSEQRYFASESAYANGTGTPAERRIYTHDAFVRVVRVDRQVGATIVRIEETAYDGEGRVASVTTPEGTVNHRHDALGRLTRTFTGPEADPVDDTRYAYDALGRLATVTVYERNNVPLAANARETTTYAYDLLGNLAWQRRPDGTLADYTYDAMSRLDTLTYYKPGASPDDTFLQFSPRLASFDYAVRADGRRSGVVESVYWDEGSFGFEAPHTSTTTWTYDDLGRLVDESIDHYVDALDQTEHFVYDLAGNRRAMTLDRERNGSVDETTTYTYDANDRLNVEVLDYANVGQADRTTTYGYDHTQQASKGVVAGAATLSQTTFGYDRLGRMAVVTATTYAGGVPGRVERTTYGYDSDGIRVSALFEVDANADGTLETATKTEYLNDEGNPTGYVQALRETTRDAATGQVQKVVVYAIGLDQVSQTTTEYSGGQPGAATTLVLGADGHGSTRFLTDLAGTIATIGVHQVFDYDAYGNLLNLDAGQAATTLLYSGEMFDVKVGLQYLRARWYDAATGRFNSLDSFFGNSQDPQSLHKYLYAHADPVMYTDPSGEFSTISMISAIGIGLNLATTGYDAYQLVKANANNRVNDAAFYSVALSIDLLFLLLPFSGPFAGGGRALAAIGGRGSAGLSVAAIKGMIQAQEAYGGIRTLWGGGRGLILMAEVAGQASDPAPPIVPQKLTRPESDGYREEARGIWQQITGIKAGWRGYDIHHRVPLEWAHIFSRADPNRVANLVAVKTAVHKQINRIWADYARAIGGRTPTQKEVLDQAIKIDKQFGQDMKFIDETLR